MLGHLSLTKKKKSCLLKVWRVIVATYLFTKEVCVMHTSLNFVHTINTYLVKCIWNIVECKVQ